MSETSRSVIHDLGYRRFTGQRQGDRAITTALFVNSLGQAFGIGRGGKAKIIPWAVVAIMTVPALVLVTTVVQTAQLPPQERAMLGGTSSNYFAYPYWTQLFITIFAATQAPVLFARDLRYRSIVLYFARPISRARFVLTRLAALASAIFLVIASPMLVWFVAAVSVEMERAEHLRAFGAAMVGVGVLAVIVAGVSALVSSVATRSGLAVAAIIVAFMVPSAMISIAIAMAAEVGTPGWAQAIASFHPFTAVAEMVAGVCGQPTPVEALPRPTGVGVAAAVAVCVIWAAVPVALLTQRMRKAASL